MNLRKLLILLATGAFMWSCGDDQAPLPLFKHTVQLDMDNIANVQTIKADPMAHSGRNICRVDSGNTYGVCYVFTLPDSLVGKQLGVNIDAWVRTGNVQNNCDILCSVTERDSVKLWNGIGVQKQIKAPNEWTHVTNNILLRSDLTKPNTKISIIVNNIDAKSYFDVDDLVINFFETE